ncbi:MAG: UPF0182 family protein [Clostridia bacterium]
MKKKHWLFKLLSVVLVILIASIVFLGFYSEYLEILEIGKEYTKVFFVDIFARVEMFIIIFAVVYGVSAINLLVIRRNVLSLKDETIPFFKRKWIFALSLIPAVIGAGAFAQSLYGKYLLFKNSVNSTIKDPVFNLDLSYYFFKREFLQSAADNLITVFVLAVIISLIIYIVLLAKGDKAEIGQVISNSGVFIHLAVNAIILCVVVGFTYYFKGQGTLLDQSHTFAGAGYVDVNIRLPFYTMAPYILFALSLLASIFLFAKKFKQTVVTILIFPVLLIGMNIVAVCVDELHVSPNETTLESPYIKNSIEYTKIGFRLDNVTERTFPAENNLTREVLNEKSDIINNIRITDPRATEDVLNSTKSIRNYYVFNDSDIVEYEVDGKNTAVNVAVREMDVTKLDTNANNYINRTFKYTHGYGITMNAVNSVNREGQPDFIIGDMPISSVSGAPNVTQPRIYYGEKTNNYCIVNTDIDEFDYALNNENVEANYEGEKSGIEMNMFNRLLFSAKYADYTMLVSGYINSSSRLLTNRNILERVNKAVPFMAIDSDPYILITDEGKLVWVVDLYTYSRNMPYSKNYGGVNYIRNSAKAVVDAYEGTVKVYITDETDCVVMTYDKIYPGVFEKGGLPKDLQSHIRYPEYIFNLQSEVYLRYHMNDPEIFYSNSDLWMRAKEKYRGENAVDVQPYYNLLSVEDFGRDGAQLVLMMPFVPANKENLVGWLAADSYGNLISYKFPSGRTVYGTLHIENRIDADADISKELSLWNQGGSQVLRGNVLVIPIADSIIYVEPVYITTSNNAAVPEVKRIIVSYGDQIVMRETLDECFNVLFGSDASGEVTPPVTNTDVEIAQSAAEKVIEAYDKMQSAFKNGDWSAFGDAMGEMDLAIGEMR